MRNNTMSTDNCTCNNQARNSRVTTARVFVRLTLHEFNQRGNTAARCNGDRRDPKHDIDKRTVGTRVNSSGNRARADDGQGCEARKQPAEVALGKADEHGGDVAHGTAHIRDEVSDAGQKANDRSVGNADDGEGDRGGDTDQDRVHKLSAQVTREGIVRVLQELREVRAEPAAKDRDNNSDHRSYDDYRNDVDQNANANSNSGGGGGSSSSSAKVDANDDGGYTPKSSAAQTADGEIKNNPDNPAGVYGGLPD